MRLEDAQAILALKDPERIHRSGRLGRRPDRGIRP